MALLSAVEIVTAISFGIVGVIAMIGIIHEAISLIKGVTE